MEQIVTITQCLTRHDVSVAGLWKPFFTSNVRAEIIMERKVIETLKIRLDANKAVALISVVSCQGSSPAKQGCMMVVDATGLLAGTVGGGSLEHEVIKESIAALASGKSEELSLGLSKRSKIAVSCSEEVRFFIKVFNSQPQLIIVGGGHIGYELYLLGLHQGFQITIFDDRPDLANETRYPKARLFVGANVPEMFEQFCLENQLDNSYITIATNSHETDRVTLAKVAHQKCPYMGMIGSSRKISKTVQFLHEKGLSDEVIEQLNMPMGLNIATIKPKEIALSIISEILMVKNGGTPQQMKKLKGTASW